MKKRREHFPADDVNLLVDRDRFRLIRYKRHGYVSPKEPGVWIGTHIYEIAVGADGTETPRGIYTINHRARDPEWMVPDSEWAVAAGLTPGTVIEGGTPENPLIARWLGITPPTGGIGIHGTADRGSIGKEASHGCIRMREEDVIELYPLVPTGARIAIA